MAHRWTTAKSAEEQRSDALHRYSLPDQSPERSFDLLAEGLAKLYRTSFALVTFMDATHQHVKAASGLEVRSIPLASSVCQYLLTSEGAMIIGDTTQDERVMNQTVVTGLHRLRFYAGAPIQSAGDDNITDLLLAEEVFATFSGQVTVTTFQSSQAALEAMRAPEAVAADAVSGATAISSDLSMVKDSSIYRYTEVYKKCQRVLK
ncbi:GAF domain-containing protein [Deinococcus oregonensis]|uniref:GAF domain-containing protein n=1 Tax=Deinococcus oregonensis TaxID=1805970 RepID=A0ABV6AW85_9DEIO